MSNNIDIRNKVIQGDNVEVLKNYPDNTFDAVVTDPPYGISFMGKKWDYDVPSTETWKEVLRVLKPGGHILVACGTRTQHRMAVNIEDAGFEIRDLISWVYGCLDTETDILTQDGWKGLNDISTDDFIFSFKDGKIIKNSVKHVFEYAVDNLPMQYIHNKHTSQLLTPNHKMLIQELNREVIEGHRETEWEKKFKYVDAIHRPNTYNLPLAGKYDGSNSIGKDFAELIGWVVAEGHYQKDTNAVNLYQSSVNMEHVERINWLLGRLNIKHSKYERERTYKDRDYTEYQWYISGEWADKIKEVVPTKGLHWGLLELPYGEKLRLVDGLVKGDGSEKDGKWEAFYQKGRDQLDIFQALLHTIDKVGLINDNKQTVSVRHKPTTQIQGKHNKEEVNYTGKVWCIETEVGNFMARRDDKIFITGNSGFPKSHNVGTSVSKIDAELGETYKGFGTALKPAMELWTLARKPLTESTIAKNVIKHGTGGINIDDSRVATNEGELTPRNNKVGQNGVFNASGGYVEPNENGRFPANMILGYLEDEYLLKDNISKQDKKKVLEWLSENT